MEEKEAVMAAARRSVTCLEEVRVIKVATLSPQGSSVNWAEGRKEEKKNPNEVKNESKKKEKKILVLAARLLQTKVRRI